jgi:hypothetical protein
MKTTSGRILLIAALVILPALVLCSAASQITSLIIAGQSLSAKVIQVDGRNYVEVEGIARLTHSSMSFNADQIVLTLPGSTTAAAASAAAETGFSKDFVSAGIEAMAQLREWRTALKSAIERSYPLTGGWLTENRAQAQQALRLASLAVNTTADRNTLPFLANEFTKMSNLSDKYLQMSVSRSYIEPRSLDSDPLDKQILNCAHSLASMATANQFVDDGSCQ